MPWTLKFWKSNAQPESQVVWNWGAGLGTPEEQLERQPEDVSASQITDITNALNDLAALSPLTAFELGAYLDEIRIGFKPGNVGQAFRSSSIDNYILIDYNAAQTLHFFNTKGQLVQGNVALTIMHELAHIYLAAGDPDSVSENAMNSPDFDFRGPVIDEQNRLAQDAGLDGQIQTSYFATILSTESRFSEFTVGVSYSFGGTVDTTRLGTDQGDYIDHSQNTFRLNDLIFGRGGDDQIKGGDGNDYLYGGAGADQLWGGEGPDVLIGQEGDDLFVGGGGWDEIWGGDANSQQGSGDGVDTVDYSTNVGGIKIHLNGFEGGLQTTVEDAFGAIDRLHSIERIVATDQTDYLSFEGALPDSLDPQGGSHSLTIDMGGGKDVVAKASGAASAIEINIDSVGTGTLKGAGPGVVNLLNAKTKIIGSRYDDEITDLSVHDGRKKVDGGDGNDVLTADGSNATLYGGRGADTINGGSGNDVIYGDVLLDTEYYFDAFDELNGGAGSDYIVTSWGHDTINGGIGNDFISIEGGEGTITGGAGNDTIRVRGDGLADIVVGAGDGHDLLLLDSTSPVLGLSAIISFGRIPDEPGNNPVWIKVGATPDANGEFQGIADVAVVYSLTGESVYISNASVTIGGWGGNPSNFDIEGVDIRWINDGPDPAYLDEHHYEISYGGTSPYYVDPSAFWNAVASNPEDTTPTSGDDDLTGGADDDALSGGDGNDTFNASGGNDSVDGGNGDDTLSIFGSRANISVTGSNGTFILNDETGQEGTITITGVEHVYSISDGVSYTIAALMGLGSSGADELRGGPGDDSLSGLAGDDIFGTSGGNDAIDGGEGTDTLTIFSSLGGFSLSGDVSEFMLVDQLGREGTLTVRDVEYVRSITDGVTYTLGDLFGYLGTEGDDVIEGSNLDNELNGLGGNDTLIGNGGNDLIDGGAGADTMIGGLGSDTYYVDNTADVVIEAVTEAGEGGEGGEGGGQDRDGVYASLNYTLSDNVENLGLVGEAATHGTGNSMNNSLFGNDLDNFLLGLAGSDYLDGGAGDDTLVGGEDNDYLYGGEGADALVGGNGDDFYEAVSPEDIVIEDAGAGFDAISANSDYTLGANVEALYLNGDVAVYGTGNELDNDIRGNDLNNTLLGLVGNDTLSGNGGDDVLDGGVGTDTVTYSGASSTYAVSTNSDGSVTVTDQVGADGTDRLVGIERIYFEEDDTTIDAAELFPSITMISGTEDADFLVGTPGIDQIDSLGGDDFLIGDSGNDILNGGDGNDALDGGFGADALTGGAGDDVFVVDDPGDAVIEHLNGGSDTVISSISYVLGSDVESLVLIGPADIDGTGNNLANALQGDTGANVLEGLAGDDTLLGMEGSDTLDGGTGEDVLTGGDGADTLVGGADADLLHGSADGDILYADLDRGLTADTSSHVGYDADGNYVYEELDGGSGNDILFAGRFDGALWGGSGNDLVYGGVGSDSFTDEEGSDLYVGSGYAALDQIGEAVAVTGSGAQHDSIHFEGSASGFSVTNLGQRWYRVVNNSTGQVDHFVNMNTLSYQMANGWIMSISLDTQPGPGDGGDAATPWDGGSSAIAEDDWSNSRFQAPVLMQQPDSDASGFVVSSPELGQTTNQTGTIVFADGSVHNYVLLPSHTLRPRKPSQDVEEGQGVSTAQAEPLMRAPEGDPVRTTLDEPLIRMAIEDAIGSFANTSEVAKTGFMAEQTIEMSTVRKLALMRQDLAMFGAGDMGSIRLQREAVSSVDWFA